MAELWTPPKEEPTGEDYIRLLESIRSMKKMKNRRRRILLCLSRADEKGWWVIFDRDKPVVIWQRIFELRRMGWWIEVSTTESIGTWQRIRFSTTNTTNPALFRRHLKKHAPLSSMQVAYRFTAGFMDGFRAWFYGVRKAGLVQMLTKDCYGVPAVRTMLKTMGLWDLGVRGMDYRDDGPKANTKAKGMRIAMMKMAKKRYQDED